MAFFLVRADVSEKVKDLVDGSMQDGKGLFEMPVDAVFTITSHEKYAIDGLVELGDPIRVIGRCLQIIAKFLCISELTCFEPFVLRFGSAESKLHISYR